MHCIKTYCKHAFSVTIRHDKSFKRCCTLWYLLLSGPVIPKRRVHCRQDLQQAAPEQQGRVWAELRLRVLLKVPRGQRLWQRWETARTLRSWGDVRPCWRAAFSVRKSKCWCTCLAAVPAPLESQVFFKWREWAGILSWTDDCLGQIRWGQLWVVAQKAEVRGVSQGTCSRGSLGGWLCAGEQNPWGAAPHSRLLRRVPHRPLRSHAFSADRAFPTSVSLVFA